MTLSPGSPHDASGSPRSLPPLCPPQSTSLGAQKMLGSETEGQGHTVSEAQTARELLWPGHHQNCCHCRRGGQQDRPPTRPSGASLIASVSLGIFFNIDTVLKTTTLWTMNETACLMACEQHSGPQDKIEAFQTQVFLSSKTRRRPEGVKL